MSFDSKSLERLEKLGRSLPKELPKPKNTPIKIKEEKSFSQKIENEDNPQNLFHSLMEASEDGNISTHLLKKLENLEKTSNQQIRKDISDNELDHDLYSTFKYLLLEEDDYI